MLKLVSNLLIDSEVSVIWIDEILTTRAVDLLTSRSDKIWSLCDAVSFVLMKDMRVSEALTTDHDFEQAGLVKLLLS